MGTTLQLRLPGRLTDEQLQHLVADVREQLHTGAVSAVVCQVDRAVADLATVDAVARLALVARRAGAAFTLEHPGTELASLLGLVGLGTVLVRSGEPRADRGVSDPGPVPPRRAGDPSERRPPRRRGGAAGR